jgi:hypothetical protein
MNLWKQLRVLVLLLLLLAVASDYWLGMARLADWNRTKWVTLYPVAADGSEVTRNYVASLSRESFDDMAAFLQREGQRYGLSLDQPLHVQVAAASDSLPPALSPRAGRMAIAWWSLRMRWWSWRQNASDGLPSGDVQLFLLYRDTQVGEVLDRSVGIRKGRYGVLHLVASRDMASRNRVVIMHELLHVMGASDKYDLATGQPWAPQGLANPDQLPLYPQTRAEIMGGQVALSASRYRMPAALAECVIGPVTALEISW